MILSLRGAEIGYARATLFSQLDLDIEAGSWVTLLGRNGAGKSTLLRSLLGIQKLRAGKRICQASRLGYVPQRFAVSADTPLTVDEFLGLVPGNGLGSPAEASRENLLEKLGIRPLFPRPLSRLSGGQLQKVLFAFALWNDPEIVFLDEYSEGIDISGQEALAGIFVESRQERRRTVIEVSHDLTSVMRFSDRVILVNQGIVYDGSPKEQGFHQCLHQVYGDEAWLRHQH